MASAPVRRAPYKDTLQPALHKRFSSTATLLLVVSYLEALLLASWSSFFWPWFPLGPTGVRAAMIFTCGLATLILRIAHYHAGLKTESGVQTLRSALLSLKTYETCFWYGLSSAIFGPIYLWSLDDSSNLRWIVYLSSDRAKLNERPLFLTCYLLTCALVQTCVHYGYDIDRLLFIATKSQPKATGSKSLQAALDQLPNVLGSCVKQAAVSLVAAFFLYFFTFRSAAWTWALVWLRPFYNIHKANVLPPSWPSDIFLLMRCVISGSMLNFIWATGNTAFSVFMARPPLKNGKPLTSDSKDPNGSLLNGLKSKKLSIQSFAMWELAIIATDVPPRRQALFTDIDRKEGPMWSQIYTICMGLLKSIEERVDMYGKPIAMPERKPASVEEKQKSSAPLKQDDIFSKPSGTKTPAEKAWDTIARSPGKSPMSDISPIAKKTWRSAKDRVLTKAQQEAVSSDHLKQQFETAAFGLLKVDFLGSLFRRSFRTEFAAAVLGGPLAEPTLYANASKALSQLAIHSLAEDQFGHVHRDVATIVRTLSIVITKVEALKARFPFHWTDATGSRDCPEVDYVLDSLREGLDVVVTKFEPYSGDLRLTAGDIRLAKEAVIKPEPTPQHALEARPKEEAPKAKTTSTERREAPKPRVRLEQRRPDMEQVR